MGCDAGSDQTILLGLRVATRSQLELDAKAGEQAQGFVEHLSDFTAHTRHIEKAVFLWQRLAIHACCSGRLRQHRSSQDEGRLRFVE